MSYPPGLGTSLVSLECYGFVTPANHGIHEATGAGSEQFQPSAHWNSEGTLGGCAMLGPRPLHGHRLTQRLAL